MSLWDKLKRAITGYDELPETAVGLDGTITTPNRYKAQLQAQAQGLPANVVNGMAQGLNSGNTLAENILQENNAKEIAQPVHHKGMKDIFLGMPEKNIVAYNDKGQPLYSETERKGGLINDFTEGFRDNFNNRLSAGNLADNTMADGRQKNLINRIGEGFGTVGRILESPMGRSLLVGGLVGATGGSGLQALGYGLGTGMLNQQNRMKDRVYRNSLLEQTQRSIMNSPEYINAEDDKDENGNVIVSAQEKRQQMLDDAERQVNSYRGYIGDDTYKQVLTGMQLRDNAEYRNALLKSQLYNQEYQRQQKQAELDYKRNRDAKEDYYEEQKLAQGWAKINNDKKGNNTNDAQIVMNQLEELMDLHKQLPQYKTAKGLKKGSAVVTGFLSDRGLRTNEVSAYEGVQNMMVNLVARKIAGEKGVMTDKDFDRVKKMVPSIYDTPAQAQAKYNALKLLFYANPNNAIGASQTRNTDNDPLGIR